MNRLDLKSALETLKERVQRSRFLHGCVLVGGRLLLGLVPTLDQRQPNTCPDSQGDNPRQSTSPSMRLLELRCPSARQLKLLERDDDGLTHRDHEGEHESPLLLVTSACFIDPSRQKRGVATVAADEDEDSHAQLVRHVPAGQDGVVARQEAAHGKADRATATDLVGDVTGRHHESEVDRADGRGDVVDLRDRVELRRLEVQREVLDDVGTARQGPEAVPGGEGVYLPGPEDAADDRPVKLADGLAAFLFDTLPGALALPLVEIESLRCVGSVWVAGLLSTLLAAFNAEVTRLKTYNAVDSDRDGQDKVKDEQPPPGRKPSLAVHTGVQGRLQIAGEHLAEDAADDEEAGPASELALAVP